MITKECILLVLHWLVFMVNSQSTIDLSNPIWIKDGYSDTDSSFGYTVSLLNNNFLESSKQSSPAAPAWVFIGAPKGNHFLDAGSVQRQPNPPPPTSEPGVIWRCSLGSSNEVCEIINVQNPYSQSRPNCHRYYHQCPWLVNQNGSWMGGSMSVSTTKLFREGQGQGGAVTCAHRWQRTRRSYVNPPEGNFVNGICYWLPQKSLSSSVDDINQAAEPLIPLVDEDKKYYRSNYQQVQEYEYYYGEAGFSSHLTEDNHLILGAPGVHTWSGSVIYYDNPKSPAHILSPAYYYNQVVWQYDLYGYSVTSGKFVDPSNIIYAAGAPRANNLLGSVILFETNYNSEIYLHHKSVLSGTQLGSYFGFTLCAVDIDGDKIDELLVGAPFTSLPESADNSAIQGEGDQGCVKIYSFKLKGHEPDTICAEEVAFGARFGSAIAALGDINNDNLNDFAVGAPGENEGRGAVYIYHGRKGGFPFGKDTTATQIIRASEIVSGLNSNRKPFGFGSSLHGGVDVDGNRTPDLVIGSYLNNSVIVLRTRPTAQIKTDVTFLISNEKAEKFSRDDQEFDIKYCIDFRITPQPSHATELDLWTYIAVDKVYQRFSILKGGDRKKELNSNSATEFQTKVTGGKQTCIFLKMKRNKEFEPEIPESKLQIQVEAQVWYNATKDLPVKTISYTIEGAGYDRPRVVVSENNNRKFKNFCTFCPLSSKSDLLVEYLSIEQDDCKSTGTAECESDLKFKRIVLKGGKDVITPDKNNQFPFEIGSSKVLTLLIPIRNDGETAYNPIVEIKALFDEEIRPIQKPGCDLASDRKDPLQKIFRCKIGRPLHRKGEITQEIAIDVRSLYAKSMKSYFEIAINAYPKDKKRISHSVSIEMKADAKVQLTGSTNERQASVSDTSHINIVHTYTASLKGKSPIDSVSMKFVLPVNFTKKGKETQTLISVSKPSTVVCSPTKGYFNAWNNQMDSSSKSYNMTNGNSVRNKRDTKSPSLKEKDTLVVNCDKPWTCMEVTCDTKLPAEGSVKVEFVMHIDNKVAQSILKKEEHKKLIVVSKGYIGIFTEQTNDYKKEANSYTTVTIQFKEEFPVWIAIVSGIGGLILLLLMTLGLARCGFFRRKTKEDLKALKSKTESDALLGEKIPMRRNDNDEDSDSD